MMLVNDEFPTNTRATHTFNQSHEFPTDINNYL